MGSGLFFCRSVGSHASSRLYFPHHDISVLETHLTFGMDLDTNGAFGDDGVGGVGHDLLAVQPGSVGVATDTDFDPIPVFHVKDFLGLSILDGITLAGYIGESGHVSLETAGFADLDLLLGVA